MSLLWIEPSFDSSSTSQHFYRALAATANCSAASRFDALVLQRSSTRLIVNVDTVVDALRSLPHVSSVRVVDLATMDAETQMQTVCRHRLLVGVHGQGMEWGHMLNGADPRGAGLIEFRFGAWPCYYAQRMAVSGIATECQEHSPMGLSQDPKKDSVRIESSL